MNEEMIRIITDGACKGNPGPGGWGVIILAHGNKYTINGFEPNTTNNRMELLAAINALKYIKNNNITPESGIEILTDSQYLKNGITLWINNWLKNNWKTANRQVVKNSDLWKELLNLISSNKINWTWVKGHNGHALNEEADNLANMAIEKALNDK